MCGSIEDITSHSMFWTFSFQESSLCIQAAARKPMLISMNENDRSFFQMLMLRLSAIHCWVIHKSDKYWSTKKRSVAELFRKYQMKTYWNILPYSSFTPSYRGLFLDFSGLPLCWKSRIWWRSRNSNILTNLFCTIVDMASTFEKLTVYLF